MQCFYENELFKNKSRRQIKSFSVQQFFKNAAEVWASSPHLRSKSKLYHEIKQKSKKQSKESQLPSKSEGCNERYGFRGNCDSQASWGCAPALPNRFRVVFLRAMFHMKQSEIHCNCSPRTVARYLFAVPVSQGGAVLSNVINLKRILNGKQNVWKYQNGEEKSDSDGREKDV